MINNKNGPVVFYVIVWNIIFYIFPIFTSNVNDDAVIGRSADVVVGYAGVGAGLQPRHGGHLDARLVVKVVELSLFPGRRLPHAKSKVKLLNVKAQK